MGGNFKIRVVENIGKYSESTFGPAGSILSISDSEFRDLDGYDWYDTLDQPVNIKNINNCFSDVDEFQTKFELVEEE